MHLAIKKITYKRFFLLIYYLRVHSGNSVALLSSEWRLMIRVGDGDWQTLWIDCMSPKCGREISWEGRYCMSVSYILVQWHWQKSMDASGFGVPSSKGKRGDVLAVLYYSSSSTPGRLSKLCYALLQEPLYVSKKIQKRGCLSVAKIFC